jgi:hypothetical protein
MTSSINANDSLTASSCTAGRFHRGIRVMQLTPAGEGPDHDYGSEHDRYLDDLHNPDLLRIFAPHEAGYSAAQVHGFKIIRQLENAVRDRDSYAGRYTVRIDSETGDEHYWDCSDEYEDAHILAWDLAADAALGNALTIIDAQRRDDEVARLIRLQRVKQDNTYIPW